ncbi:MAG: hypothetical protein ACRDYU_00545 [Actinomycetes bacterium]
MSATGTSQAPDRSLPVPPASSADVAGPGASGERQVPRLASGLRLYGEYQGTGFAEPQYIARRADGQVLQLSRLLYLVASEIDGARGYDEVADAVAAHLGRPVSADNIAHLVENRLVPSGLIAGTWRLDGGLPRTNLLLGLRLRGTLLPASVVERVARGLAGLHVLPIVFVVLACWALVDLWLFVSYGAISSLTAVLQQPALLLPVAGLSLLSLVVHEFGHASACRYGGARPGRIGYGIYLVWPALYTDVTDVYRIGRAGRLRTDLGGVYFNVVFILVMAGCYALTGHPLFLAVIYLCHFEILQQLLPIVRLDGYFILGDLAGVPDLFGKVRPILTSLLPRRDVPASVAGLKRGVRVMVTIWVLVTLPLLFANLAYAAWRLPELARTAAASFGRQMRVVADGAVDLDVLAVAGGAVSGLLLILPTAGLTYLLCLLARRLAHALVASVRSLRARAGARDAASVPR